MLEKRHGLQVCTPWRFLFKTLLHVSGKNVHVASQYRGMVFEEGKFCDNDHLAFHYSKTCISPYLQGLEADHTVVAAFSPRYE